MNYYQKESVHSLIAKLSYILLVCKKKSKKLIFAKKISKKIPINPQLSQ